MNDEEYWARQNGLRSRGYLPHIDRKEGRQFITYRLADSVPQQKLREWTRALPEEERRETIERFMDSGFGECLLARRDCAEVIRENLDHHDGDLYWLRNWIIMPNHVHVDIVAYAPLGRIHHAWKSYTSKRIKAICGIESDDPIWQREYFDRYIRDEVHAYNVKYYIYLNPVKAGLVDDPFEWEFSSIHAQPEGTKKAMREWFEKYGPDFYKRWRG